MGFQTCAEAALLAEFRAHCLEYEQDVAHFYLDSLGNPTIGRGHLVANFAQGVSFDINQQELTLLADKLYLPSGQLASPEMIRAEFAAIKTLHQSLSLTNAYSRHRAASYYRSESLVLKPEGIEAIWLKDTYEKAILPLRHCFYQFAQLPQAVQLILIDISYQSGVGYFTNSHLWLSEPGCHIKSLVIAVKQHNWVQLKIALQQLHGYFYQCKLKSIDSHRAVVREAWAANAIAYQASVGLQLNPVGFAGYAVAKRHYDYLQPGNTQARYQVPGWPALPVMPEFYAAG